MFLTCKIKVYKISYFFNREKRNKETKKEGNKVKDSMKERKKRMKQRIKKGRKKEKKKERKNESKKVRKKEGKKIKSNSVQKPWIPQSQTSSMNKIKPVPRTNPKRPPMFEKKSTQVIIC